MDPAWSAGSEGEHATTAAAATDTGFGDLAGTNGFIAVFAPSAGRGWAAQVTAGLSDDPVDERWLSALLDRLLATEPIDPDRVFVAGFSIGAVMTDRLACRLADRIAAAAVVGGTPWAGECARSKPVSILQMHGESDPTFRFDGAVKLAAQWRDLDHCSGTASPAALGTTATIESSTGCSAGTGVDLVAVQKGIHTWFAEPDATTLAWDFFTRHGR